ncbi:MAG: glycosyltransferase family 2 protein, partial [Gammaproteobacteria bacterium]|nr:glycosyltransferase family 2 protein [Gammaproteobacteria bacterium]
FSDASIMLDRQAILNIVKQFQNEMVGCVSGEDHIREDSGEGAYGRYELFLRNQESRIYSIVGASGSFYAQRKSLCTSFIEGMAPDFLSVLNVAEQGYRSVTEPSAFGEMTSVKSMKNEFQRKVRTFIRGMSALFLKKRLMNPFKYGVFSILLISHKLIRWLVPCFLLILLVTNIFILEQVFYQVSLCAQVIFYLLALIAYMNEWLQDKIYGKIPLYFTIVNLAIIIAWFKYLVGVRQEIWNPSDRKV